MRAFTISLIGIIRNLVQREQNGTEAKLQITIKYYILQRLHEGARLLIICIICDYKLENQWEPAVSCMS